MTVGYSNHTRIGPRGDRRFNKADIDMFLAANVESTPEAQAELVLVS